MINRMARPATKDMAYRYSVSPLAAVVGSFRYRRIGAKKRKRCDVSSNLATDHPLV